MAPENIQNHAKSRFPTIVRTVEMARQTEGSTGAPVSYIRSQLSAKLRAEESLRNKSAGVGEDPT